MRRAAVLALAAFALVAGTARADVFTVVPTTSTVLVPPPPAVPEQLSQAQLLALWQGAGAQYDVPWQVLAAINKIESDFGRNMGPSSAGAVGWMQFMPATWMGYGVDANGDGVADPWNAADAIYSAARYLAANHAATDLYGAIFQYNHADWYVHEVLDIANLYTGSDTIAFTLDKLQRELDEARQKVADAGDALQAAEALVERLDTRAAGARLLSSRLDLEQRAAFAAVRRNEARAALAQARQQLREAQDAAQSASFDPTAGDLLGAPAFQSGYVFPVGGGPGLVSVSHSHHDYPAADIAAPEGEPVYALADAVVVNAWTEPDPRCGIGLTLTAFDGQTWTYCHLSVLDPAVVPGASLSAGQQVGLVGHTGDATGPHLHLQLQPASEWPQQEPWFISFAGSAFSWQDANAAGDQAPVRAVAAVQTGPVFQVVPTDPSSEGGVVEFSLGNP
jgi:murein DD-endopeptidase MepM/ murein hydrolase activator NlpD